MIISYVRVMVAMIFFYIIGRKIIIGFKQFINALLNFVGLLTFLNLGIYFSSSPGLVAVMIYTQPLFIVITEILLGNKIRTKSIVGVVLGVLGITGTAFFNFDLGLLFGILGGLSWGVGVVYYRRNLLKEDLIKLNASMGLLSLPVLLALTPIGYYFDLTLTNIGLLLALALIAQVGGFYFWFNAIKHLGSVKAGSGSLLVPIMAYVFSFLFFQEIPTLVEMIGSAITLLGVYLTMTS